MIPQSLILLLTLILPKRWSAQLLDMELVTFPKGNRRSLERFGKLGTNSASNDEPCREAINFTTAQRKNNHTTSCPRCHLYNYLIYHHDLIPYFHVMLSSFSPWIR
ncbi:hypothetical protein F5X98DRAFT_217511 [Xylaria grammica]|nr:hypothetical protein F5X98DRAFT_217511 [Xylaria grammica]